VNILVEMLIKPVRRTKSHLDCNGRSGGKKCLAWSGILFGKGWTTDRPTT